MADVRFAKIGPASGHVFSSPRGGRCRARGVWPSMTDEGTNATIATISNADGRFISAAVPIGTYTITVTKTGFSTYTEKSVEVHPTQIASVNPRLNVGTVTERVEVSAGAVEVETSTA